MELNQKDHEWLLCYRNWVTSNKKEKAPSKPKGFDLRLQGSDPMGLYKSRGYPCKGGDLVPKNWTSSTKKPEWPSAKTEQLQFNL